MGNRVLARALTLTLLVVFFAVSAIAQSEIVLKNSFIRKYMDRVTMDISFVVDHAHKRPNTAKKDGDLHIAGRSKEVGLPMVVEIMNAKSEKPAVELVHDVEGTEKAVSMKGVWRIWCEHPGSEDHVQGQKVAKPEDTNPDHVFEIHPVTLLDTINLLRSLTLIEGYDPYSSDVFEKFEKKECEIVPAKSTTTIRTKKMFYNYVQFKVELSNREQKVVDDGRFVYVDILDSHGEPYIENIRAVFVKGSEPENVAKGLGPGDTMHILAIPRINLSEVWSRVKKAKSKPEMLKETLPYEMIVVGIYK